MMAKKFQTGGNMTSSSSTGCIGVSTDSANAVSSTVLLVASLAFFEAQKSAKLKVRFRTNAASFGSISHRLRGMLPHDNDLVINEPWGTRHIDLKSGLLAWQWSENNKVLARLSHAPITAFVSSSFLVRAFQHEFTGNCHVPFFGARRIGLLASKCLAAFSCCFRS